MKTNIDDLIKDNEARQGTFRDTAPLAQTLKSVMRTGRNWEGLSPESKEALERTVGQIARILSGQADDAAHWNGGAAAMRVRGIALDGELEASVARLARTSVTRVDTLAAFPIPPREERKAVDG